MTLLSVRDLSVSIRGAPILNAVSLEVATGEIVALTGESGSGKSMTGLSVIGLLPEGAEAAGRVELGGQDMLALPERDLCAMRGNDVGMIFQEPMTALNPLMTIGDQVAEVVRVHGGGRAEARARAVETLGRVGLDPVVVPASRYPHELSGGQRQRVVIAIAVVLRPRLLIADEPTTALDVTTQARILDLLKGLVAEFGMGAILITHDLAVVAEVADRVAVMKAGKIVETGDVPAIFTGMRHDYTKALLAASSHRVALPPVTADAPLLEVRDVVKEYGLPRPTAFAAPRTFRAVDRVSLTVRAGERVGLVGESGCGKSTLTRAILGLETIQDGTITLGGRPIVAGGRVDPAIRRRMQVVFQDPYGSFDPRHRVARLVAEPFHLVRPHPDRRARRRAVEAVLTDVGLRPQDADRYIHQFSGGQRQRIAIARALITGPDLIVFDEAVSALDVSVQAQILDLLADLSGRKGMAWLFISHDLSVVRKVTDRILVMKDGRIVEEGETGRVMGAPSHGYTRALLAAAPTLPRTCREV